MAGGSSIARSQDTTGATSTKTGFLSRSSQRTNRSGSLTNSRPDHVTSKASEIQTFRILLCVSLLLVAAVLGVCVFFFFQAPEINLAKSQFESIAGRAKHYAHHSTEMKRLGVIAMATTIGIAHPNKKDWPFVLVDGYGPIAHCLVQTIMGDGMGFAPIVTPEQLADFETFAYDSYESLGYPNGTATSMFGRGVWAKDAKGVLNLTQADQKYHEGIVNPNGETSYDSRYQIYAPVLQHSDGADAKPLMLNLHNERRRGQTIDSILACTKNETLEEDVTTMDMDMDMDHSMHMDMGMDHSMHMNMEMDHSDHVHSYHGVLKHSTEECGQMTDMLLLTQRKTPATLIMQPIFPGNDPFQEATGIVSSPLNWRDVLKNAFPGDANGIHCVLTTSTGISYTYYVEHGVVDLVGEGDLHDVEFEDQVQMVVLTDEESGLYSKSSYRFTLKIYPTEIFMATYRTQNPLWGTVIVVFIMAFLTFVFCLYDWYVRGEFTFKNELLEAKRSFIRFVSHEVRTPLNAVCMGLMLMREELEKAMEESKKIGNGNNTKNNKQPVSEEGLSEWKGVTDEILENSQNAVDVLNDLLNYDKITTGSLKLELSLLEVGMLMDHAQKEFKLPATKKKIDVSFKDDAALPYKKNSICIVGDDVRLIQVLRNLMSNALKFTPPHGKVTVKLSWVQFLPGNDPTNSSNLKKTKSLSGLKKRQSASKKRRSSTEEDTTEQFVLKKGEKVNLDNCGYLQLSVSDTGAGMSEEQMSNVFDKGTQFNVNELQAGQGSGLGLYIAKGIMEQHLGSLTVASEGLGKGTTFTMSVPVYRDPKKSEEDHDVESQQFHFKASKAKSAQQQGLSDLRILVVDDSDTNRKFLTRILANHGHTCDQAPNGSVAVDMVSKSMKDSDGEFHDSSTHYDAVLLDFEMPIMNGPTAAQKMRQLGSDTFIVGITGNVLPEDIEHFRDQGANEVLPKPFNISDLEEILLEYGVGSTVSEEIVFDGE